MNGLAGYAYCCRESIAVRSRIVVGGIHRNQCERVRMCFVKATRPAPGMGQPASVTEATLSLTMVEPAEMLRIDRGRLYRFIWSGRRARQDRSPHADHPGKYGPLIEDLSHDRLRARIPPEWAERRLRRSAQRRDVLDDFAESVGSATRGRSCVRVRAVGRSAHVSLSPVQFGSRTVARNGFGVYGAPDQSCDGGRVNAELINQNGWLP